MTSTPAEQNRAILSDKIETPLKDKTFPLFDMTVKRLVILLAVTFGLYGIYWAYKNWSYINQVLPEDKKIWPVPRAIFALFFTHSLYRQTLSSAKAQGFAKNYSAGWLAVLYIATAYISNGLARSDTFDYRVSALAFVLLAVGAIPLVLLQQAINFNNAKLRGNKVIETNDSGSSTGEKVFIGITVILGVLIYIGYLVPTDAAQPAAADETSLTAR